MYKYVHWKVVCDNEDGIIEFGVDTGVKDQSYEIYK